MLLRGRGATSLGDGIRLPPPFIDDGVRHPYGNQARDHALACAEHD
jgi:hypothetical protein